MTPAEKRGRADRVALVLSVPCGSCHTAVSASCFLAARPDLPVLQLDASPAYAHPSRVARAVRLGRIGQEEIEAQCRGGVLPEERTRPA